MYLNNFWAVRKSRNYPKSNASKADFRIPKIYLFFIAFALNLSISLVFTYFVYQAITKFEYILLFSESMFVALFMTYLFPKILVWMDRQNTIAYEEILETDYPLLMDIKRFSVSEYNHAIRVSRLAKSCVREIRGNELTSNDHCFPKDVISILTEYGGIIKKPQSQESAVVHMCDVVVSKMEALSQNESMRSNWNQDMVIYQTLNEYSQRGFYDESGLSINQFLLVRERMIREESIL